MTVVDVHAHYLPAGFLPLGRAEPGRWGFRLEEEGHRAWYLPAGSARQPLVAELFDGPAMLAAMDRQGVDLRVISLVPTLFHYEADRADAVHHARLANEEGARLCAGDPRRLRFLAHLPLAHPEEAAREARRAVRDLGAVGLQVGTTVRGAALDEPDLEPVWQAAAELAVPVLIHPILPMPNPRPLPYYLGNAAGHPFETAVAACRLILAGHLSRYPELTLLLAHAGGALPYIRGRVRHSWDVRPEARRHLPVDPDEFWHRLWFDTITHDPAALRYLAAIAPGRVVLGSDSPFDMGTADPVGDVRAAQLEQGAETEILRGGARLFQID